MIKIIDFSNKVRFYNTWHVTLHYSHVIRNEYIKGAIYYCRVYKRKLLR